MGRRPSPGPRGARLDWRGLLLLFAIYVAVAFLWRTEWVLPLKLFVVLLHETSHAVAAMATGGRVVELRVHGNEGGHCVTTGGIEFVIVSAGYLGSLAFGATLLLVATRTNASRHVAALLGALLAVVALRFMPGAGFGTAFAAFCGATLASLAICPPAITENALRVIGVTSLLYAILDIKNDVLDRDHPHSDASRLAVLTGVPAVYWGLLWIGVSVVVTAIAAKWAVTGTRRKPSPRSPPTR